MEVIFEERRMKGFTTPGEGVVDNFSLSACDLRLFCLRLKNRARRSEMRTIPPTMPPIIASVGFLLGLVEAAA